MPKMTSDEMREFLDAPRIAHLTTLRTDGSPHTAPVWYEYDDGAFHVFTFATSVKLRNLGNDPRIAISVGSEDEPYRYVVAEGASHVTQRDALARASSIASRYRGEKGPAYAAEIDSKYGGLRIVSLRPSRLTTWRSDD